MSKESDARVRDELLQTLYAGVLEAKLAHAAAGRAAGVYDGSAVAAGVAVNLRPGDLLLLPDGRGDSLRVLRGRGLGKEPGASAGDLQAGLLDLPQEEGAAVAMALGVAATLAHRGEGALACVHAAARGMQTTPARPRAQLFPKSWAEAGDWAARHGLPLLLLTEEPRRRAAASAKAAGKPAHLLPAPLFPTIPVDREDALAIYRVAFECVARMRAGGGPSELRCVPVRSRSHSTDPAAEPDPLSRLEAMLRKRGAFQASWKRRLERDLVRKLSGSRSSAASVPGRSGP